jgi:hypothetical protein
MAVSETKVCSDGFVPGHFGANSISAAKYLNTPGVFDIRSFGAVGDGVTDDTVAVQAALTYAADNGVTLKIPKGTFIVSAPLVVLLPSGTCNKFRIVGEGMSNSRIDGSATSMTEPLLFIQGGTATDIFYNCIRDLALLGNSSIATLQIGRDDFSDKFNSLMLSCLIVGNVNPTEGQNALRLNGIYGSVFQNIVANCHNGGTPETRIGVSFNLRQTQFSTFSGSAGNAKIGIEMGSGYVYGNVFNAVNIEVTNTCIVINGANVLNNSFIGGTFVYGATGGLNATAGTSNAFINNHWASMGESGTKLISVTGCVTPTTQILA